VSRNAELIQEALRKRLLAGRRITAVTPLSTGHSNETYLLHGLDQILRLPPSGPSLTEGLDMAAQFQLYAVLARLPGAPPVPRVIYYCDDPDVLGSPFYLVQREAGAPFSDYDVPAWWAEACELVRERLSLQYVHTYASLAKVQPLDVLGPVMTPVAECQHWQRFATTARHERLVALVERLINIPHSHSGPASLVHGDAKMANMLWLQGRLQSVLDWELAINGDPLADLGYMLNFFASDAHPAGIGCDLPGMWSRERVICEWEQVSGRSAHGVEWFEAAAAIKVTSIMAYGYHLATTGRVADARYSAWLPYIQQWTDITERIIETLEVSGR
jgi:aminoglycoside phosphotransferase (APT) family kinase protein